MRHNWDKPTLILAAHERNLAGRVEELLLNLWKQGWLSIAGRGRRTAKRTVFTVYALLSIYG